MNSSGTCHMSPSRACHLRSVWAHDGPNLLHQDRIASVDTGFAVTDFGYSWSPFCERERPPNGRLSARRSGYRRLQDDTLPFFHRRRPLRQGYCLKWRQRPRSTLPYCQSHLIENAQQHFTCAGRRQPLGLHLYGPRSKGRRLWCGACVFCRLAHVAAPMQAKMMRTETRGGISIQCDESIFNAANARTAARP
jgi:hypothetical protein